jgi:hypothetical protein
MAGINGSVQWGIVPLQWSNSSQLANMAYNYRYNSLISANNPMRYQIIWTSGNMSEDKEPTIANAVVNAGGTTTSGDIVNVIFDIYSTVQYPYVSSDWDLIASIKKSRDISNKHYINGNGASGHRFTIDISALCQDLLSYSLVPIGKGTWQDFRYGGMNGGLTMQDNVTENISDFNVSKNGCFRTIRVVPRFEILNADSGIEESTHNTAAPPYVRIINSAPQFDRDDVYYSDRTIDKFSGYKFLTHSPNNASSDSSSSNKKQIRISDESENLYFYLKQAWHYEIRGANLDDVVGSIGIKVETYLSDGTLENTFYVTEFSDTLDENSSSGGAYTMFNRYQSRICVQNISPYFINNTADLKERDNANWATYSGSKITDSTSYYRVSLVKVGQWSPYNEKRSTHYMYYSVGESENNAFKNVRFHWLNRMGGIDSYTAKRDIVEGLSISRDTIERKQGDRTWNQNQYATGTGTVLNGSVYHSNTMRGGDIYKGGREVMNVNADRNYSVYTEPLNRSTAEWLEEIMTSPNVWIEMESESTKHLNAVNPYQRPSTKEYMPVIITNGDIETVNQEQGLVKFNIEYTLAHKITTQRN